MGTAGPRTTSLGGQLVVITTCPGKQFKGGTAGPMITCLLLVLIGKLLISPPIFIYPLLFFVDPCFVDQ